MRPEILFNLFTSVTTLPGVGAKVATNLVTLCGGDRIVDLLWHLPTNIIDRRHSPSLSDARAGTIVTLKVFVEKHLKAPTKRAPYKVLCRDETGFITIVFFHAREDYLNKILPVGEERIISGTIEQFGNDLQMTHPDHVVGLDERDTMPQVEAVYPLTAGLSLKILNKTMKPVLESLPNMPEWLDDAHCKRHNWINWRDSLLKAHAPENEDDLSLLSPCFSRLAYDELLANQLALAIIRKTHRKLKGRSIKGDGNLQKNVLEALPFQLTNSQHSAIAEVQDDMASDDRMLRLLQGDVGSGKTMVAFMAILSALECGYQAALMAPTEILARQHAATLTPFCEKLVIVVTVLTGREKGKKREAILEQLNDGTIKIAIGTHALFQDGVNFQNLGLAVIDEQHRFGVHQRLTLANKGNGVDMLVMTATPIPRTLMLTAYGDMDVSRLLEKPIGRKPIETRVMPIDRLGEVAGALKRTINGDARIYWVCPLVEESEKIDAAAAEERHAHLSKLYSPERVGLVHGRMKGVEKDAVMAAFKEGQLDILVATTVIEVGVDVPEATVMVIEHAERFGLAQLHQLRGRIGRGDKASVCLLIYGNPLSETAKARLKIMRETEDGFVIAEEDLKLRGAGELLGTRQSGLPEFRIADLTVHGDLLADARRDAQLILDRDPDLKEERGKALRTLLYLFECDSAIMNLRSG